MSYIECGFDIGIKNLSYCVIKRDEDNVKHKIIDWELIDLRDDISKCCGILRNGKICEKPAKMYNKTKNDNFYCKSHISQYKIPTYHINELKNVNDDISMYKCVYINKNNEQCENRGCFELNSDVYCKKHIKSGVAKFERENKLSKYNKANCMHEPLYDLGTRLYNALDNRPNILRSDKIVIENQPAVKNPTMKSVSIMLFSYFIMKQHKCVMFVAPSGKLKVNQKLTEKILSSFPKKMKYEITKKLAIVYSKELIINNFKHTSKWIDVLEKSHKKDDLCDAFLHAYYHLFGSIGLSDDIFYDKTLSYFLETFSKKNKSNDKKNTISIIV